MNTDPLKTISAGLGEPALPPNFERTVMARIARVAETLPRPVETPVPARRVVPVPAPAWYDVPAWLASLAGVVLFFVSWIAGHLEAIGLGAILAQPEVGMAALVQMPTNPAAMAGLALGAVLYVAGLFAENGWRRAT